MVFGSVNNNVRLWVSSPSALLFSFSLCRCRDFVVALSLPWLVTLRFWVLLLTQHMLVWGRGRETGFRILLMQRFRYRPL
jgi:hypothetical protein